LKTVSQLNPVSYDWNTEVYSDMSFTDEKQIGFIAQDIEKIIPELVKTDSEGNKAVAYDKLTPILVKAIQDQQKEIEELKNRLKILEENIDNL
jgi:hypothetical protein